MAIINGNDEERMDLCATLRGQLFEATGFPSLPDFENRGENFEAVIFDLAGLPVTNQLLQKYSKSMPELKMPAISDHTFHPELRGPWPCVSLLASQNR